MTTNIKTLVLVEQFKNLPFPHFAIHTVTELNYATRCSNVFFIFGSSRIAKDIFFDNF